VAAYYFDANAVVKYYVLEPGSTWIREIVSEQGTGLVSRTNTVFISDASITACAAGFAVLFRMNRIRRSTRDRVFQAFIKHITIGLFRTIPVGTEDFRSAAYLTQDYPLKGYDAVQLAVALRQNTVLALRGIPFTLVSGDNTLLNAARGENLLVDNPFDHISPEDSSG